MRRRLGILLNGNKPKYYDEATLFKELERVFDICHGCRRCVNLCNAFPTLFDLIDESDSMEIDSVKKEDYWQVVDHCYLCDLCYLSKCPYVPPHEWNVDFPHLMLQAKAIKHKQGGNKLRDKLLTATDTVGKLAGIPVVAEVVNAANNSPLMRKATSKITGIHPEAILPKFHSNTLRKRFSKHNTPGLTAVPTEETRGKSSPIRYLLRQPSCATVGRGSDRRVRTQWHTDQTD